MPFKKGKSGNPKGRTEGSQNRKTEQWEAFAQYCLNGGLEKFEKELNSLKGEKYVYAFLNLLEYHKPKLARTEIQQDPANNIHTVKIEWLEDKRDL